MSSKVLFRNDTLLKDALYNTHRGSGASKDYAMGLVVGIVSALMAMGYDYSESIKIVARLLPRGYRIAAIPECWNRIHELYAENREA